MTPRSSYVGRLCNFHNCPGKYASRGTWEAIVAVKTGFASSLFLHSCHGCSNLIYTGSLSKAKNSCPSLRQVYLLTTAKSQNCQRHAGGSSSTGAVMQVQGCVDLKIWLVVGMSPRVLIGHWICGSGMGLHVQWERMLRKWYSTGSGCFLH